MAQALQEKFTQGPAKLKLMGQHGKTKIEESIIDIKLQAGGGFT